MINIIFEFNTKTPTSHHQDFVILNLDEESISSINQEDIFFSQVLNKMNKDFLDIPVSKSDSDLMSESDWNKVDT